MIILLLFFSMGGGLGDVQYNLDHLPTNPVRGNLVRKLGSRGNSRHLLQYGYVGELRMQTPGCDPTLGQDCTSTQEPTQVPSPATPERQCFDTLPEGAIFDCTGFAQQGLCDSLEQGYCEISCGICCEDVPIPGTTDCSSFENSDLCSEGSVVEGGYCQQTCGVCGAPRVDDPAPKSTSQQSFPPSPSFSTQPPPTPAPTPSPAATLDSELSGLYVSSSKGVCATIQNTGDVGATLIIKLYDDGTNNFIGDNYVYLESGASDEKCVLPTGNELQNTEFFKVDVHIEDPDTSNINYLKSSTVQNSLYGSTPAEDDSYQTSSYDYDEQNTFSGDSSVGTSPSDCSYVSPLAPKFAGKLQNMYSGNFNPGVEPDFICIEVQNTGTNVGNYGLTFIIDGNEEDNAYIENLGSGCTSYGCIYPTYINLVNVVVEVDLYEITGGIPTLEDQQIFYDICDIVAC